MNEPTTTSRPDPGVAAAQLDRQTFGELFRANFASLVLVAASEVGPSSAEDVVQDAAIIAQTRLERFTPGTDFRAWLAAIVRGAARNYRRKEQRKRRVRDEFRDSADARREENAPKKEQPLAHPALEIKDERRFTKDLTSAVESLPDVMRSALLLRVTLDHSYAEIGAMLELPEATARSHVHRARNRIFKALAPEYARPADG
ncbi:MAG: RNA polymerase sigma factor [Phycisphaerales bacterium]